ncbi:hypothetical protein ACXR0O_26935 [Verrucomicrobiota bacterium sgz303538]
MRKRSAFPLAVMSHARIQLERGRSSITTNQFRSSLKPAYAATSLMAYNGDVLAYNGLAATAYVPAAQHDCGGEIGSHLSLAI